MSSYLVDQILKKEKITEDVNSAINLPTPAEPPTDTQMLPPLEIPSQTLEKDGASRARALITGHPGWRVTLPSLHSSGVY